MDQRLTSLLFAACVLATARAQIGVVDTDWLMDDPHKADRLPIWNQLMGNRGFGYGSPNQSPVTYRGWNNASGNSGSSWNLPTLYRIILLRQMLNNNNNNNNNNHSKTPTTPSRASNDVSNTSHDWRNQLQNFYRVVLLTRLFGNQNSSNSNASSRR